MGVDLAFDALADPIRREILAVLADHDECTAGELSSLVGRVGRTAVSSHVRKLHTAGLVQERRTGRYRYYSLNPDGPARDVLALLQDLFRESLSDAKGAAQHRAGTSAPDTGTARAGADLGGPLDRVS